MLSMQKRILYLLLWVLFVKQFIPADKWAASSKADHKLKNKYLEITNQNKFEMIAVPWQSTCW